MPTATPEAPLSSSIGRRAGKSSGSLRRPSQLGVLHDSLSAADSRIKDVDVAQESTNYARYSILVQAGTAMLAQANQSTQSVMKLLQ